MLASAFEKVKIPASLLLTTCLERLMSALAITPELRARLAPTGTLRASINLGNPILARRDADGQPAGVSIDLARGFAELAGLPLELVVFDAARNSVEAVTNEEADFGFFAIDPLRGAAIAFSAAYVLIEGAYLVRDDSALQGNAQVDAASNRVVVGQGSAYDLYLTRELKNAAIVRAPTSQDVAAAFLRDGAEVMAGIKQQLEADALALGGLRLLPGRFMVIQQARGVAKSRGDEAASILFDYVEGLKASGFIEAALRRHGIQGASVAPAAKPPQAA